jgi:hypothetical protein
MDTTLWAAIIGAVVTIITGAVAVGVTVWQIRKTEREIIKSNYSHLMDERRTLMLAAVNDAYTRKWLLKKFNLSDIPKNQEKFYLLSLLNIDHYQHVYYRRKNEGFPDDLWASWKMSMNSSFATDEFQAILLSNFKTVMSQEFRNDIENGFDEVPKKKKTFLWFR